jgi:hypothetical protein
MAGRHRRALLLLFASACNFESPSGQDAIDNTPILGFEFPTSGADEATGTLMISVTLDRASDVEVSVSYEVSGGTASPGTDFSVTSSSVTFAPGDLAKTIPITISADADDGEADETIEIRLFQPTGAKLGAAATHEITISDHILPRVSFAEIASTTTEETQTMLVVNLDRPSEGTSTVVVGIAGGATPAQDFTIALDSTITIADGATTATIPIGEVDDALDEDPEMVTFTLKGPSSNLILKSSGIVRTHTINDNDDPPVVSFAQATSTVDENVGTATVTVALGAPSGRLVTVSYDTGNGSATAADATVDGAPGTLTFQPGETSKPITVTITDDTTDENVDVVAINLTAASNATVAAPASHGLSITDNDAPPSVSFMTETSTAAENAGAAVITVRLSAASERSISVPFTLGLGTATLNVDFTVGTLSPLTFVPNQTTRTITIDMIDDADGPGPIDDDETVLLNLGNATNASELPPTSHTLTIEDSD